MLDYSSPAGFWCGWQFYLSLSGLLSGSHDIPRSSNLSAPTPSPELTWLRWIPSRRPSSCKLVLYVMKSPQVPVVLGRPWFVRHNPQIDCTLGTITGWSPSCHASCLLSASGLQPSFPSVKKIPPDLSAVPAKYHNLGVVFSKA